MLTIAVVVWLAVKLAVIETVPPGATEAGDTTAVCVNVGRIGAAVAVGAGVGATVGTGVGATVAVGRPGTVAVGVGLDASITEKVAALSLRLYTVAQSAEYTTTATRYAPVGVPIGTAHVAA